MKNESSSKQFIKKFDKFTSDMFGVKWLTKKVKTLFRVKNKSLHQACKIYKGVCSFGESYIGETIRNVEVLKRSSPSKHIKGNLDYILIGQCWLMLQRTCFNEKY